jgi:hypothetical protein
MKLNLNTQPIGLFFGLLAPIIVFLLFYLFKYSHITFSRFIDVLMAGDVFVQILSMCVIVNLLIFFLFIWTHRYYAARGVIMATFIYTIGVVIIKFI